MSKKALTYEEALTYLASIRSGSLPIVQGRVIKSSTKYIAGLSAGLGQNNGQLILPSTVPAVGVTNFPKGNMLPKGINYLIVGVRALFDTTSSVALATATWKSEAPANWKNGEFKINQNGAGNLFETSVTDVTNFKASTSNDDDFRDIVPVLLRAESAYELQTALAAGATTDQAYKFEFRVIEIVETQIN
jgi:hypothetical protein